MPISDMLASQTPGPNRVPIADGSGSLDAWVGGGADIQALLDGISSTQGTILYRNATDWVALAPGTAGFFLKTNGAAANPAWAAGAGGVSGPVASTNLALVRWDGTTGTLVMDSSVLLGTGGTEFVFPNAGGIIAAGGAINFFPYTSSPVNVNTAGGALEVVSDGAGLYDPVLRCRQPRSDRGARLSFFNNGSETCEINSWGSGFTRANAVEIINLTATGSVRLFTNNTAQFDFDYLGNFKFLTPGGALSVPSGTNQRAGNATLVAGTVTVSNTTVTANTIVMLTRKTSGGTIGTAITYTLSAGTSFTVNSDNPLDTSTFSYFLIECP